MVSLDASGEAACDKNCPVRKTARIIEGKWTTLIIRELLGGSRRYSELQRGLQGISPKVLAVRLRFLAEQGLIERTVYDTIPPTTEYALTDKGKRFEQVIQAMADFGDLL